MNEVELLGWLARDPEVKHGQGESLGCLSFKTGRDFGGVTMDKKTKRLLKELALIGLVAIILYFVAFVWFFMVFGNVTVIWG